MVVKLLVAGNIPGGWLGYFKVRRNSLDNSRPRARRKSKTSCCVDIAAIWTAEHGSSHLPFLEILQMKRWSQCQQIT